MEPCCLVLKIFATGIDYTDLRYGLQMAFATVGSNNGHNGNDGIPFTNNTEVLADFTMRSIHVENIVSKAIIEAFYGSTASRSYYLGCSLLVFDRSHGLRLCLSTTELLLQWRSASYLAGEREVVALPQIPLTVITVVGKRGKKSGV